MKIDYQKVLDKLYSEFDKDGSIRENVNKIVYSDWKISNVANKISNLYAATIGVIIGVEKLSKQMVELTSKRKRKAVAKFLDGCIEGGWLFELIDGMVINKVIDMIVGMLNDKYGHDWFSKIDEIMQQKDFIEGVIDNEEAVEQPKEM